MSTIYATAAEVLVTLISFVPSSDDDRVLFEAASTADQTIFCAQATVDLDGLRYAGCVASTTQQLAWPRVSIRTNYAIDPDPTEPTSPSVAGLPLAIRRAHAVQSAHRAALAAGLGNAQRLADAAHRGVQSAGSGGRSEGVDLRRANAAAAALCVAAHRLLKNYLSAGVDFA